MKNTLRGPGVAGDEAIPQIYEKLLRLPRPEIPAERGDGARNKLKRIK